MTDAPLTPAEAFVLLDPVQSRPSGAFKIAFLTLIAQGVLAIRMPETRAVFRWRERLPVVTVVGDPPPMFLAAEIINVIRRAETYKTGATIAAVRASAVKIFGNGLLKLKKQMILPALAARGLALRETDKFLGLPLRTRYVHSPSGLAEKRRIEMLLDRARLLPSLIESDPAEAKAVILAAGPLLLLVPELKGIYGQLAALDPVVEGVDGADFSFPSGGETGFSDDQAGSFDFGSFDVGALDMDFGAFDASFDSSFDDGGGDGDSGGGDSGGGDSGGGGGPD